MQNTRTLKLLYKLHLCFFYERCQRFYCQNRDITGLVKSLNKSVEFLNKKYHDLKKSPNVLTSTGFLRRDEHYSAPVTQSKSKRHSHNCLSTIIPSASFICSYCHSYGFNPINVSLHVTSLLLYTFLSPSVAPLSLYLISFLSHLSSSSSSHSFLSLLLTLPLSKWIVISHYPAQRLYAWGWDRSSVGMKEKPPAMNTTICVQSLD